MVTRLNVRHTFLKKHPKKKWHDWVQHPDRVGAEFRELQIVKFGDKSFGWPDETTQHLGGFYRGQEGHGTPARDEPRSLGDCRAKLGLNPANEEFGQTASMYE